MVKTCLHRNVVVVQAIGVDLHLGSSRAAAKKIHGAASADHVHCPLPGERSRHSFNGDIHSPMIGSQATHRRNGVDHVAKADGRKLFRNIVHHTRKHAIWLILLSRFVFGFRMAIPATVGALGMSTPRFLIADFAGSIIWAVAMGATGYAAGHVGQLLIGNEWEVGFVLMALTLGWGVYRRRHVQQVTTLIDRTDELVGHPGGDEPLKVDDARALDDE